MRMMVVLPAPLLPRRPTISSRSTWKLTLLTAQTGPKFFVRFSTWIMFASPSCLSSSPEQNYCCRRTLLVGQASLLARKQKASRDACPTTYTNLSSWMVLRCHAPDGSPRPAAHHEARLTPPVREAISRSRHEAVGHFEEPDGNAHS